MVGARGGSQLGRRDELSTAIAGGDDAPDSQTAPHQAFCIHARTAWSAVRPAVHHGEWIKRLSSGTPARSRPPAESCIDARAVPPAFRGLRKVGDGNGPPPGVGLPEPARVVVFCRERQATRAGPGRPGGLVPRGQPVPCREGVPGAREPRERYLAGWGHLPRIVKVDVVLRDDARKYLHRDCPCLSGRQSGRDRAGGSYQGRIALHRMQECTAASTGARNAHTRATSQTCR